jgi:starvation-inducible outer membrane lipoprotein
LKNKFLKVLTAVSCLNLFACVMEPKIITGPDGTPHQLVSCSDIESCYKDAAEVCGGKYKIVNTSNEVSSLGDSTSSTTSLLVKCGK